MLGSNTMALYGRSLFTQLAAISGDTMKEVYNPLSLTASRSTMYIYVP